MSIKKQADFLAQLTERYTFVHKQAVDWGDMDAFKHINNVVYYRYAENARIPYMNKLGAMRHEEIHIVIFTSSCKYVSPVVFPDTLYIGTRIEEVRNTSFRMIYDMYSMQQQQLVAQAEAVIVTVNSQTNQKCAIPASMKQEIYRLEAEKGNQLD